MLQFLEKGILMLYREIMILDCRPITHVHYFLPIIVIVGQMTMHIIRAFKGLIISKSIHTKGRGGRGGSIGMQVQGGKNLEAYDKLQ